MKKITILLLLSISILIFYGLVFLNTNSNLKTSILNIENSKHELSEITNSDPKKEFIEKNNSIINKLLSFFLNENIKSFDDLFINNSGSLNINEELIEEKDIHIKTPDNVKSLYFSSHSINNEKKFNDFLELAKNKEINSIMIDIKEVDGYTSIKFDDNLFGDIKPVSNNRIKKPKELIELLHENNIYTIARIAVFKDKRLAEARPDLAVKWISSGTTWSDYSGNKYTDQFSTEIWDYHVELGKAAYELGFDEINYDYIRFPTDGYISKAYYSFAKEEINKDYKWGKVNVIDKFGSYLNKQLKEYNENIIISADVFGLVTDYTMHGIGQNLESFLMNFDYIGPMVYPSHYGEGYYGYKYPDNNPYEIINTALNNAITKIDNLNIEIKNAGIELREIKLNDNLVFDNQDISNKVISKNQIRPYLQGFSCTRCNNFTLYNRDKFRRTIKAVNDVGLDSWWVRSSGSYYRDSRYNSTGAILKDEDLVLKDTEIDNTIDDKK